MSIATDLQRRASAQIENAREQGLAALSAATTTATGVVATANKRIENVLPSSINLSAVSSPALAAIGAADLVAETVTARIEALPADAITNLAKAQTTSKARIAKAQEEAVTRVAELRTRFDARVSAARDLRSADLQSKAKDVTEAYLATAKTRYGTLSGRGEAKLAELRKDLASDPRLTRLIGEVNGAADLVEARVRPVVGSVEAHVSPVIDTVIGTVKSANPVRRSAASAPAKKAPARKAPASQALTTNTGAAKSTARNAPAKKAPARKAPAKKAPAKKATARKSPAS
ncbi:MAG: Histone H1-like nucleoprotein [Pseudonocardiales bacterium]|jgi:vacuolar-type H+-ATPase subunit H|nr:Histone H1-like nucleoprotein [Pseudonocardiales bacterium]